MKPRNFRKVELPPKPAAPRITAAAIGESIDTRAGAFAAEDARRRAWLDEQIRRGVR